MKTPKERDTTDLLELTLQLHSRANRATSKEMHDAYVEARQELDSRILANKISANVPVMRSLPFDFIKMFWSLSDEGVKQLEDAYEIWLKRQ